jgi:hypothetical protein
MELMGAAFFTSAGEIQAEVEEVVSSGWGEKEIPFDKFLTICCWIFFP